MLTLDGRGHTLNNNPGTLCLCFGTWQLSSLQAYGAVGDEQGFWSSITAFDPIGEKEIIRRRGGQKNDRV